VAKFIGGPCDGRTAPSDVYATRVCGGVTYYIAEDGNYHSASDEGGAVGVEVLGTHAPKGWHDLQVSVNRRLPTALNRAARLRHATQRKIGRKRRLR
jgi:hypothetical protein